MAAMTTAGHIDSELASLVSDARRIDLRPLAAGDGPADAVVVVPAQHGPLIVIPAAAAAVVTWE